MLRGVVVVVVLEGLGPKVESEQVDGDGEQEPEDASLEEKAFLRRPTHNSLSLRKECTR